jgi:hypothetical protein
MPFVVWPSSAAAPEPVAKKAWASCPRATATRLLASALGDEGGSPADKPERCDVTALDLDGDSARESLYLLRESSGTHLFVADDGNVREIKLSEAGSRDAQELTWGDYKVVATADLDGDNARELFLAADYGHGWFYAVARVAKQELAPLGWLGCGS